jgi:hypothetical protein
MRRDTSVRRVSVPALSRAGLVFLWATLLWGCFTKPIEPVAPRWEVALTAPITVKRYTLEDLVAKDTSALEIGAGGQVVFHSRAQTPPSALGNIFSLAPFDTTAHPTLGPLSIGALSPISLPLSIPGATAGDSLPPLTRFSLPPITVSTTQFEVAQVKSGTVTLSLRNDLPVPLTLDSVVTLRDSTGSVIASLVFSPAQIPAGAEGTSSVDLSGKSVPGKFLLCNVSISEGGVSRLPSGDLLVATISSDDLMVSSVVLSMIPPQVLLDNSTFSVEFRDSSRIREASIQSGQITLNVQSEVGMNMFFRARFGELWTSSGSALVDSFYLPARATIQRTISLAGLTLRSADGSFVRGLDVVSTADLYEGSAGRPLSVSERDSLLVHVSSSAITVDSVVGAIKPASVEIDQEVAIKLGEAASKFRGQFVIPAANLIFTPEAQTGIPMQLDLKLQARDQSGRLVELPVPPLKTAGPLEPIVFPSGEVGDFLTRVSGKLPDTLALVGTVLLNPDYDTVTVGSVGARTIFSGLVDFSVPLTLRIAGGGFADTLALGDTTGDGNSDYAANADFFDKVNAGTVHFELENDFPLGVKLVLHFLDHERRLLLVLPQTSGDSLVLQAAVVSGGEVVSPGRTVRTISLSEPEVRLFAQAQFVRYGISLETPGADPVNFRASDALEMRVWSEFTYEVKP